MVSATAARGGLAHRAALLADQEHHRIAAAVILHAGDERVAAFDAVDQALLAQEIERAIDGDRRRARSPHRQPVDQLVGAERLVARQQRLQHAAADRRQALGARGADRLGMRDGRRWRSARGRDRAPGTPRGFASFWPRNGPPSWFKCNAITAESRKDDRPPLHIYCTATKIGAGSGHHSDTRKTGHLAATSNEDCHAERENRAGHRLHLGDRARHRPRARRRTAPTSCSTASARRPPSRRSAPGWKRSSASRRSIRQPT